METQEPRAALVAVAALPCLRLAHGYHGGGPAGGVWPPLGLNRAGLEALGIGDKVAVLKLATPHPLPERLVGRLLEAVDVVLVAEEVDPFVELHVKALAKDVNPDIEILGRMSGHLPANHKEIRLRAMLGQDRKNGVRRTGLRPVVKGQVERFVHEAAVEVVYPV